MTKEKIMQIVEKIKADKEVREKGFWAMLSKYGEIPTVTYAVACALNDVWLAFLHERDPRVTAGVTRHTAYDLETENLLTLRPDLKDFEAGYYVAIGDQKTAYRIAGQAECGKSAMRQMTVNLCCEEGAVILPGRPVFEGTKAMYEFI